MLATPLLPADTRLELLRALLSLKGQEVESSTSPSQSAAGSAKATPTSEQLQRAAEAAELEIALLRLCDSQRADLLVKTLQQIDPLSGYGTAEMKLWSQLGVGIQKFLGYLPEKIECDEADPKRVADDSQIVLRIIDARDLRDPADSERRKWDSATGLWSIGKNQATTLTGIRVDKLGPPPHTSIFSTPNLFPYGPRWLRPEAWEKTLRSLHR